MPRLENRRMQQNKDYKSMARNHIKEPKILKVVEVCLEHALGSNLFLETLFQDQLDVQM